MPAETRNQRDAEILLLDAAVFCLDCEVISNSRGDECPSCKGHSLLSLAKILGGSLRDRKPSEGTERGAFDITLTVELREMHAENVNATLERLTSAIAPQLARGQASFHIDVQTAGKKSMNKAA